VLGSLIRQKAKASGRSRTRSRSSIDVRDGAHAPGEMCVKQEVFPCSRIPGRRLPFQPCRFVLGTYLPMYIYPIFLGGKRWGLGS
jgi:hypothetical protein